MKKYFLFIELAAILVSVVASYYLYQSMNNLIPFLLPVITLAVLEGLRYSINKKA